MDDFQKDLADEAKQDQDPNAPEGYTPEVKDYLDTLRESGETNMLGAGAYLERRFQVNKRTAREWLKHWMYTFSY